MWRTVKMEAAGSSKSSRTDSVVTHKTNTRQTRCHFCFISFAGAPWLSKLRACWKFVRQGLAGYQLGTACAYCRQGKRSRWLHSQSLSVPKMWGGETVRVGESVSLDIRELTDSVEGSSSGSMDEQKGKCRLKVGSRAITAVVTDNTTIYGVVSQRSLIRGVGFLSTQRYLSSFYYLFLSRCMLRSYDNHELEIFFMTLLLAIRITQIL
jgi:hypothetical protein